jgi:hypothetical protein
MPPVRSIITLLIIVFACLLGSLRAAETSMEEPASIPSSAAMISTESGEAQPASNQSSEPATDEIQKRPPADTNPNPNIDADDVVQLALEDLKQQVRMAAATERMAADSEWQTTAAVIGMYLSLATLVTVFFSLKFTKEAAVTTRATLDVVRNTSKAELRAYMSPEIVKINNVEDLSLTINDSRRISVESTWTNVGQTPAYSVETAVQFKLVEGELDAVLPVFGDKRIKWQSHSDKGKSQEVKHTHMAFLPRDLITKIGDYELHAFARCIIRYRDIFGRTIFFNQTGYLRLANFLNEYAPVDNADAMQIRGIQNGEIIDDPSTSLG